jgi:Domain of unknown function (DUF4394)
MNRWITAGAVASTASVLAFGMVGATSATTTSGSTSGSTSSSTSAAMSATTRYQSFPAEFGPGLRSVGLTADQRLVVFDAVRPGRARNAGKVKGLQGDTRLVGIDYRVQDRKLYGVGDAGGVYTLVVDGAKATKVSQLTVPLSGTAFGVDFNPAADRLRVVSDNGQNLRHNVNPGGTTIADTGLTTPPATAPTTGVTAAAYTNNDLDAATGTVLFDLDTALDQVVIQAPANSGQLSVVGRTGVDAGTDAGFDIYSQVRSGRAVGATSFAVLQAGGRSAVYQISLVTGQAVLRGAFPAGTQVTDLALPLDQR